MVTSSSASGDTQIKRVRKRTTALGKILQYCLREHRCSSLDDVRKSVRVDESYPKPTSLLVRSAIRLPVDSFEVNKIDPKISPSTPNHKYLYLPVSEDIPVDECLRTIPQVLQSAEQLLAELPRQFTPSSPESLLYVGQREVAHAMATQCDVIASDKATTCHILAFRSVCPRQGPMVSLTHIDAVGYDQCIRNMIQEHKYYHQEDEPEMTTTMCDDLDRINIDIYMLGGFDDDGQASRSISNFLLKLLSQIASDNLETLTLTLRTCAISCMNDSSGIVVAAAAAAAAPIGRGLGIHIETGDAFLCHVDPSVAGPVPILRSARLWSKKNGRRTLTVIHSIHSNNIHIPPFYYRPVKRTKLLLSLSDSDLLQRTSTSPNVEEDDFCDMVRATLIFMETCHPTTFFGTSCHRPAIYSRVGRTNQWTTTTTTATISATR